MYNLCHANKSIISKDKPYTGLRMMEINPSDFLQKSESATETVAIAMSTNNGQVVTRFTDNGVMQIIPTHQLDGKKVTVHLTRDQVKMEIVDGNFIQKWMEGIAKIFQGKTKKAINAALSEPIKLIEETSTREAEIDR